MRKYDKKEALEKRNVYRAINCKWDVQTLYYAKLIHDNRLGIVSMGSKLAAVLYQLDFIIANVVDLIV